MTGETLLLPRFILPVRPAGALYTDHAVVVEGERITAVRAREAAIEAYPDASRVELDSHVLLPGMVNMHTHSPMTLLRGMSDDLKLDTWLKDHIWPAEAHAMGPSFVAQGTELAMVEMLRAGTTCFNEMYFFPEVIAETVDRAGMRACIGLPVIEMETAWAGGADACLDKASDVHAQIRDYRNLQTAFAPHALYTVGDAALERIAGLSAQWRIPVHMHVLEIAWEIEHSMDTYAMQPLERLAKRGLLNDRLIAVHMAHLTQHDIECLAEAGSHAVHCPESNLKLASGICPVAELLAAGVNVSIGTDGAASNNNLDILGELRTAALLAKGVSGDPLSLDAGQAIEMVTMSAARALGLEDQIGSIEAGKLADLCALDLDQPETQPLHQVLSQVVYAASSRQFTDVWVGGRRLLEDGQLTTIDLKRVMAKAGEWNERLSGTNSGTRAVNA